MSASQPFLNDQGQRKRAVAEVLRAVGLQSADRSLRSGLVHSDLTTAARLRPCVDTGSGLGVQGLSAAGGFQRQSFVDLRARANTWRRGHPVERDGRSGHG